MLKKLLASYTVLSFMISFIAAPVVEGTLAAARQSLGPAQREGASDDQVASSLVIPALLGRITGSFSPVPLPGSPSTMELPGTVIIQDLHCHPEAQRKIAGIIASLCDAANGLAGARIFIEGAAGPVDASWILAIKDAPLRDRVCDALLESGRLTGAEYWAMRELSQLSSRSAGQHPGRDLLLNGMENETLHFDNIIRLGYLMSHTQQNERLLAGMARDAAYLRTAYLSPRNRRFQRIVERYASGRLPSIKYFKLLREYVENINEHPGRYGSALSVRWNEYPAIETYLQAHDMDKRLNRKQAAAQMGQLIGVLKERVPYSVYEDLRRKSKNFGRIDILCPAAGNLFEQYQLDKAGDFCELKKLFACQSMQQSINPLQLLREERHLAQSLRVALADDVAEVEAAFLADFFAYFAKFIRHGMTPDEYGYFRERFPLFRSLWGSYFTHNDVLDFAGEIEALDTYFAVNEQRTAVFLDALEAARSLPAGGGQVVNIVVTGGFHAEGLARGLEERQSSYIVITPNITTDTTTAGRVYERIIGEQARQFSVQALAALPVSARAHIVGMQDDRVEISINNRSLIFAIRDGMFLEPPVAAKARARNPSGMAEAVRRTVNLFMREEMRDRYRNTMNPLLGAIPAAVALSRIAIVEGADEGVWAPDGLIWEVFSNPDRLHAISSNNNLSADQLQKFPAWWQRHIVSRGSLLSELKSRRNPLLTALNEECNDQLNFFLPAQKPSLTFTGTRVLLAGIFSPDWLRRHKGVVEYFIVPVIESPVFLLLTVSKLLFMKKISAILMQRLHAANPDMNRELVDEAVNGVVLAVVAGFGISVAAAVLMMFLLPQGAIFLCLSIPVITAEISAVAIHSFAHVIFRNEQLTSWLAGRVIRKSERQSRRDIDKLAREIVRLPNGRQAVFLTGPSASGKTTTVEEIAAAAARHGRRVVRLSLDEYYLLQRGMEKSRYDIVLDEKGEVMNDPETGEPMLNYDTPNALNWDLFAADLVTLLLGYEIGVKKYIRNKKDSERITTGKMRLEENDIVLVEGIFALDPQVEQAVIKKTEKELLANIKQYAPEILNELETDPQWHARVQSILRQAFGDNDPSNGHAIFIEPHSPFHDLRDDILRLLRRLNRDNLDTGNSEATIGLTIARYDSVKEGTNKFVMPARQRSRWALDTYRAGEITFWKALLGAKMEEELRLNGGSPEAEKIQAILTILADVPDVTPGTLRGFFSRVSGSVLREFAGTEYPAARVVAYLVSGTDEVNYTGSSGDRASVRVRPMPREGTDGWEKLKGRHLKNLSVRGNRVWIDPREDMPTLYIVVPEGGNFEEAARDIIAVIHGPGVLQGHDRSLRTLRAYFNRKGILLDEARAIIFSDNIGGDADAPGEIPVYAMDARDFSAPSLLNAHAAEMAARRHETGFLVNDLGAVLTTARTSDARFDNITFYVNEDTLRSVGLDQLKGQAQELKQRGGRIALICETAGKVHEHEAVMRASGINHVVITDTTMSQLENIPPHIVIDNIGVDVKAAPRKYISIDEQYAQDPENAPVIALVTLPENEQKRALMIARLNALPVGTTLIFDASRMTGLSDGGMDFARYGVNLFGSFFGTARTAQDQAVYQRRVARRLAPLTFRKDDDLDKGLQQLLAMIQGTVDGIDRNHPNTAYAEAARVHMMKTNGAAREQFLRAAERYLRMRYFLAQKGRPLGMADQDVEELMETCFEGAGNEAALLRQTALPNAAIDEFQENFANAPADEYIREFKYTIMEMARPLIEQGTPQALRDALELLALLDGKVNLSAAPVSDVNYKGIHSILSAA